MADVVAEQLQGQGAWTARAQVGVHRSGSFMRLLAVLNRFG